MTDAGWDAKYAPWKSIESAPKDGRYILAWHYTENGQGDITVSYWGRANDLNGYSPVGWVNRGSVGYLSSPAFWMPLPSKPQDYADAATAP